MLINFNNKYFTLVAIIFGAYLFYNSGSSRNYSTDSVNDLDIPQAAKFVIEIDPKKPESEKTLLENMVQKFAFSKNANIESSYKNFDNSQQNSLSNVQLKKGDQVTLKLRKIDEAIKDVEPITIIIGNEMLPKFVEEALIGMRQDEIKLVDNAEVDGKIVKYEIKVVSILPKVELK
jgi:hypothetical protein